MAALVALALAMGGCGGDDPEGTGAVPAAGDQTPPLKTPGVPKGASYDLDGNGWLDLSPSEREQSAADYVKDHPNDCGDARPGRVADYAYIAIGTDFDLYGPAADALNEGCAAELQS